MAGGGFNQGALNTGPLNEPPAAAQGGGGMSGSYDGGVIRRYGFTDYVVVSGEDPVAVVRKRYNFKDYVVVSGSDVEVDLPRYGFAWHVNYV